MFDNKGEVTGSVHIAKDITERKQAEKELAAIMKEIQEFNHLAVDREQKMIELKEEVNRLLAECGRERKYEIVE